MSLNKQLPRTMVWASLPVQLSHTSVELVWRESVEQLSTTPLNSFKKGESWQRPRIEIQHVKKRKKKKKWIFSCQFGFCTGEIPVNSWMQQHSVMVIRILHRGQSLSSPDCSRGYASSHCALCRPVEKRLVAARVMSFQILNRCDPYVADCIRVHAN